MSGISVRTFQSGAASVVVFPDAVEDSFEVRFHLVPVLVSFLVLAILRHVPEFMTNVALDFPAAHCFRSKRSLRRSNPLVVATPLYVHDAAHDFFVVPRVLGLFGCTHLFEVYEPEVAFDVNSAFAESVEEFV